MSEEALKGLEDERDRLLKENQAKLPEEDRIGETRTCGVRDDYYVCTKAPHNSGDHVAHGRLGTVIKRWLS